MIIDARSVPEDKTLETEVCVVGAGVAGITVTRELIGRGFRVCLVECGGRGPDRATQSLFWGENVGLPYFPLDTSHSCGFGGTINHWTLRMGGDRLGVRLRPLDPIDFEQREWVPHSGWPFTKSHLDPYYERAHAICRTGPYSYDVQDWEGPAETPRLPLTGGRAETAIFHFAGRDHFVRDYYEEITRADNIAVCLHAAATELETDETGRTVKTLRIGCLDGKRLKIAAKLFILALGALETPRLLLLSRSVHRSGLGNENDLVGRFFMEHPHLVSGRFFPSDPRILERTALYRLHRVGGIPVMGKVALTGDTIRRERLLNYCVSFMPGVASARPNVAPSWEVVSWPLLSSGNGEGNTGRPVAENKGHPPAGASLSAQGRQRGRCGTVIDTLGRFTGAAFQRRRRAAGRVVTALRRRRQTVVFQLDQMTEQAPNPDSRVTLSDECDVLGRQRVRLDWRLSPIDLGSIIRAQEILREEFHSAGLGRLHIELKDETPPAHLGGGWHHMGTTRMHPDARRGVVDADCKVHGLSNLFISGPSVFPTCGYANPVLTIVALSARLGDHVKGLMAGLS